MVPFVKPRILMIGVNAEHKLLQNLGGLRSPLSVADYDALVLDPQGFANELRVVSYPQGGNHYIVQAADAHEVNEAVRRRRQEVRALLERRKGVIICLLRPNDIRFTSTSQRSGSLDFSRYALLDELRTAINEPVPTGSIRGGQGDRIKVLETDSPAREFFKVLDNTLIYEASIENH